MIKDVMDENAGVTPNSREIAVLKTDFLGFFSERWVFRSGSVLLRGASSEWRIGHAGGLWSRFSGQKLCHADCVARYRNRHRSG